VVRHETDETRSRIACPQRFQLVIGGPVHLAGLIADQRVRPAGIAQERKEEVPVDVEPEREQREVGLNRPESPHQLPLGRTGEQRRYISCSVLQDGRRKQRERLGFHDFATGTSKLVEMRAVGVDVRTEDGDLVAAGRELDRGRAPQFLASAP